MMYGKFKANSMIYDIEAIDDLLTIFEFEQLKSGILFDWKF